MFIVVWNLQQISYSGPSPNHNFPEIKKKRLFCEGVYSICNNLLWEFLTKQKAQKQVDSPRFLILDQLDREGSRRSSEAWSPT